MNKQRSVAIGLALLMGSSCMAQVYRFTSIAGQPGQVGNADGTNAGAQFGSPSHLGLDTNGNLYVCDRGNQTIRLVKRLGTNWVVTTVAGLAGQAGSVDGTNSDARFYNPSGVVADGAGDLYISDWYNHTIRRATLVETNWVVTTIAGTTNTSFTPFYDGTNSGARFGGPSAGTLDQAGNLYVPDTDFNTIRKVAPIGTNWVVTTIAGLKGWSGSSDGTNATARFSYPSGVAMDATGNLYVTDQSNNTIRRMTSEGTNWIVTTIAGLAGAPGNADGTNSDARFNGPGALAVDSRGAIYVSDTWNNTIRKITPVGTNWVVTTIGGQAGHSGYADGVGNAALFWIPNGIAVDRAGNLYVVDLANSIIRLGVPLPGFQGITLTNGGALLALNVLPQRQHQVQVHDEFGFWKLECPGRPVRAN